MTTKQRILFNIVLAAALVITVVSMMIPQGCDDNSATFEAKAPCLNCGNGNSGLPDVVILETNPYGIPPLATTYRFVSDTQFTINCPLAVFNGGFIASTDTFHMDHFLEVKSMKIDSAGNELAFGELYKPGSSNEAGFYAFEPDTIPGLRPQFPLVADTMRQNQWDEYLVNYPAFGVGRYISMAGPNAGPHPWPECPGCGGNRYYFGTVIDSTGGTWHAHRDDSFITNALKAKIKNHN